MPREPTLAMCRAYFEVSAQAAHEDFGVPRLEWDDIKDDQRARLRSFGRAMVAAAEAPKPEETT